MKTQKILAAGAASLALLTATPALAESTQGHADEGLHLGSLVRILAHEHVQIGSHDTDSKKGQSEHATSTVKIFGTVTAFNGSTLTVAAKKGDVYTVNAADAAVTQAGKTILLGLVQVGDSVHVRGTLSGNTITATSIIDGTRIERDVKHALGSIALGVVTSVSGSAVTIDRLGHATATVVTNASTSILDLGANGAATTSVQTGDRVLVLGEASTSSPNTIIANVIAILGSGFGHLKHLLSL